jgi:hypothetical protein
VGSQVELDGSASTDADGDPLTYRWSLTPPVDSHATLSVMGARASFVIDRPGTYLAQLIVNDGAADSAADTAVVSTVNSAPVANAGPDRTVDPGEEVSLDGSASHDVDGDPIGFNWSLTSVPLGSVTALTDPNAVIPRMTPDRPGAYIGQLIVNDGVMNSAPATVTITARSTPLPGPDTTPPAAPVTGLVTMSRQDTVHIRVDGAAGSVEGGAQVIVSNFTTGRSVTAMAAADGSFVASIAAADSDAVLIMVRDAAGNDSTVATAGALALFELTIDTPLPNQSLSGSTVVVTGRLLAPPNTGIAVNGRPAAVYSTDDGHAYRLQMELPLPQAEAPSPLSVPVEVTATTPDGRTRVVSTAVRVVASSAYSLEASPADGPAPLRVSFQISDNLGAGIRQVEYDFAGDGSADGVSAGDEGPAEWVYDLPGSYLASARITDDAGETRTATLTVTVHERAAFTARLRSVWDGLNLVLLQGNAAAASLRLNESARRKYVPAFEALRADLPRVVESFSPAELTEAGSEVTEFVVTREVNGVLRAFFVYMTRGEDGVWRVAGM